MADDPLNVLGFPVSVAAPSGTRKVKTVEKNSTRYSVNFESSKLVSALCGTLSRQRTPML